MTTGRMLILMTLAGLVGLSPALPAAADFASRGEKRVKLDLPAADVAFSQDGRWIFVLTGESVEVLDVNGRLVQKLPISGPYDSLALSPSGDRLVLTRHSSGEMKIVLLEQIFAIDDRGSPSRGPEKAPVTIAVFSDFQ